MYLVVCDLESHIGVAQRLNKEIPNSIILDQVLKNEYVFIYCRYVSISLKIAILNCINIC